MITDQQIIELLKWTGHLEYPLGRRTTWSRAQSAPINQLSITHPSVRCAIASYQDFLIASLEPLTLLHHSRPCRCDGVIGPATRELMNQPRCGCPDYGPDVQPAVGTGSWKRCHGIGDFHSATVYINGNGMPPFLQTKFDEIWALNVAAYDALGLRWNRTLDNRGANIEFSFVQRSNGWIGLAIVGQNQSCGSQIWCKYLATYRPSNVVREWATLVMHELGHNAGLQHTRGGVMNPGIINGLPATWKGDPAESILKRYYGGEPIDPPKPPPPPPPPSPLERSGIMEWFEEDISVGKFDVIPRAEVP